jgi:hypothetical protein
MRIINSDYPIRIEPFVVPEYILFVSPQMPERLFVQSSFTPRFIGELVMFDGVVTVCMFHEIDEITDKDYDHTSGKILHYLINNYRCQEWVANTLPAWIERFLR